ncbi:uncharacterized protein F4812DRAFT_465722 [Daldinia caldariorum]|uniref:uncharacterized protein n=1 Tax=Daldinia caldariorum TaxID=326644 RepID=UPI002008A5BB|nr:uncharacterized protein F4812DRAFT_465722 [Daldinia caldariorum]KAI1466471.1 hypothetical protein F4812DRAFT_465722 [Daldinia caldariorum]
MPPILRSLTRSAPTAIIPPPELKGGIDKDGKKRKRNQKDNSSEDPQATKRLRCAIKNFQPEPKTVDIKKRKRDEDDNATEDHLSKKSDIADRNFEPKLAVAPRNKRQRDQEADPVEDARLAKRQKLIIEKLECQLKAAGEGLESTKAALEITTIELESTKLDLESTKAKLRYEIVSLELAEEQLKRAAVQFFSTEDLDSAHYRLKKLIYAISRFVRRSFVEVYDKDTIPEYIEKRFKEMSRTPLHKFLRCGSYAHLSFEALIWDFLCTEIMENPFKLLDKGSGLGHILGEIQVGKHGGDSEALISWRAHTTQILYDCATVDTRLKGLQEQLLELLGMFIIEEKENSAKNHIKSDIENILEFAASIARDLNRCSIPVGIMRKSRSDAHDALQSYENEWMTMENSRLEDGDGVELLISPAFVKYLKPFDSGFEYMVVVQKARVLYMNRVNFMDHEQYKRVKDGGV